jgi:hypothetical protein
LPNFRTPVTRDLGAAMNEAAARLIQRIETNLKVTDGPGMDVVFKMDRDAAAAFAEHLRVTDTLLTEYERVKAANEKLIRMLRGDGNIAAIRDLVQRLRSTANDLLDPKGKTMDHWDEIRHQVETHKGSDLPRLNFESLLEDFAALMVEAAETLDPSTLHNIRAAR